jgi:hypothetical protein
MLSAQAALTLSLTLPHAGGGDCIACEGSFLLPSRYKGQGPGERA